MGTISPAVPAEKEGSVLPPDYKTQYVQARIDAINARFMLFQRDLGTMVNTYPEFGPELQAVREQVQKKLQGELVELQKMVTPPVPVPAKTK